MSERKAQGSCRTLAQCWLRNAEDQSAVCGAWESHKSSQNDILIHQLRNQLRLALSCFCHHLFTSTSGTIIHAHYSSLNIDYATSINTSIQSCLNTSALLPSSRRHLPRKHDPCFLACTSWVEKDGSRQTLSRKPLTSHLQSHNSSHRAYNWCIIVASYQHMSPTFNFLLRSGAGARHVNNMMPSLLSSCSALSDSLIPLPSRFTSYPEAGPTAQSHKPHTTALIPVSLHAVVRFSIPSPARLDSPCLFTSKSTFWSKVVQNDRLGPGLLILSSHTCGSSDCPPIILGLGNDGCGFCVLNSTWRSSDPLRVHDLDLLFDHGWENSKES